jgi:hypothetical protein
MTTRLHAFTDATGRSTFPGVSVPRTGSRSLEPVTAGQVGRRTGAAALLCDLPTAEGLIADRGHDADRFREALKDSVEGQRLRTALKDSVEGQR